MKKNIPNTLTLLNLFCGLIALTLTHDLANIKFILLWVLIAILFDFFDGFAARMLKVNSLLGKELDSLADMVTSGVVPGVVMYKMIQKSDFYFFTGALSSQSIHLLSYSGFLITLASAYRLAKFNIDERQTSGFIGLPTPANTILILSLIFVSSQYTSIGYLEFLFALIILSCYLLNAEIRLFALKFKTFSWKENKIRYLFLITSCIAIFSFGVVSLPIIIIWYVVLSVVISKK